MKRMLVLLAAVLLPSAGKAEYRQIDLKIFGMD